MINMATLYFTRTTAPGVGPYTIFLQHSFLFYIIIVYSPCLLDIMKERRRVLTKNINLTFCYPQIETPQAESHETYKFLSPFPTDATQLLMNDERQYEQRTIDDDGADWWQKVIWVIQVTYNCSKLTDRHQTV